MNVPGLDNDTPLHDAVSNGRIECVKLLISRGASFSARYFTSRKHLHTKVTPDFHLTYSKNGGNTGSESK